VHSLVRRCALALALALPGLAAGACAAPPAPVVRAPLAPEGRASLVLRPQVRVATGASRQLLAVVPYLTVADVHHFVVSLREDVVGSPTLATTDRLGADADKPLIFHGLHANRRYTILARAYKAAGTDAADLISVDANSTLTLDIATDDTPTAGVLPLQLAAAFFNTTASDETGVAFVAGGVTAGLRGLVTTFAGGATAGGVDAVGDAAQFNGPAGVCALAGTLWVAERLGHRIRRIDGSRAVTLLAGSGTPGVTSPIGPTPANTIDFNAPEGVTTQDGDWVYVADTGNHVIRRVHVAGQGPDVEVELVAGQMGVAGAADNVAGSSAQFASPAAVYQASTLDVFVADRGNNRIRRIANDINLTVTTAAGGGAGLGDEPLGTDASFDQPTALAYDGYRYLYVADAGHRQIKRLDLSSANFPVELVAGSGVSGGSDGPASIATFRTPSGLAYDQGYETLYVADADGHRIRAIAIDAESGNHQVSTVTGSLQAFADGVRSEPRFDTPRGLAFMGGVLYVGDEGNHRVRAVR